MELIAAVDLHGFIKFADLCIVSYFNHQIIPPALLPGVTSWAGKYARLVDLVIRLVMNMTMYPKHRPIFVNEGFEVGNVSTAERIALKFFGLGAHRRRMMGDDDRSGRIARGQKCSKMILRLRMRLLSMMRSKSFQGWPVSDALEIRHF